MGRPKAERYGDPRDALLARLEIQQERGLARLRSRTWAGDLVALSPAEQARKIGEVGAVVSVEVFEALLAQARGVVSRDHKLAEQIASSALLIVDRLPAEDFSVDAKGELRATALAEMCNARRLLGDWHGAEKAIREARRVHTGFTSRTSADIYLYHSALEFDLGNIHMSQRLTETAASLYRSLDDERGIALCYLQLADLFSSLEAEKANFHSKLALEVISGRWGRLELFGRLLHTESLVSLQRLPEAILFYDDSLPVFDAAREADAFKVKYLEALILDAGGDVRLADKAFKEVIEGLTHLEAYKHSLIARCTLYGSLYKRGAWLRCLDLCKDTVRFLEGNPRAHHQMQTTWRNLELATGRRIVTEVHVKILKEYLVLHWGQQSDVAPTFRRPDDPLPFPPPRAS
jgi:tetratricopeptide (TPR) repeat protein